MNSHVISLRLPPVIAASLQQTATYNRVSIAEALRRLLRNSLGNFEVLRGLPDCPDRCDAKLDVRIPATTVEPLKAATTQLGVSVSAYIRKLLYHFCVTKHLKYIQSDGHYTLAYRHD